MLELTREQVALLQAGVDALPEDPLPQHLAEARAALAAWGPPTPEHDNPLYYPLLFLLTAVEEDRGDLDRFDAAVELERARATTPKPIEQQRADLRALAGKSVREFQAMLDERDARIAELEADTRRLDCT